MNNFFRPAGNIDNEDNRTSQSYFQPAGDLDKVNSLDLTVDEINEYLKNVVSGKKIDGILNGCMTVISFSRLSELVENGCNIISAECLSPEMIVVEYQELDRKIKNSR